MTELDDVRTTVHAEIRKVIVGHEHAVDILLVAAITGGHVLMEGPPGVAKTLLSSALARALGVSFSRVQFTPDTTATEVLGETVVRAGERHFLPGAIFTNILLADEINRTPPKTQASLLEAMQERRITVDGRTRWLPKPFLVIATQNPYEQEGVFELPESQLDRFLFKIELAYGDEDEEVRMLAIPHRGLMSDMLEDVVPKLDAFRLERLQDELERTVMPDEVARAIVAVVRATRDRPGVILGGSPRAAIHLATAVKANARLAGRDTATIDDIAQMARSVLAHRMIVETGTGDDVVRSAVEAVLRAPV
jgi:MoxR-like ATPase